MIFLHEGHFVIIPSGTSLLVVSDGIVAYFFFFVLFFIKSSLSKIKPPSSVVLWACPASFFQSTNQKSFYSAYTSYLGHPYEVARPVDVLKYNSNFLGLICLSFPL
jgi:hypothetical protein